MLTPKTMTKVLIAAPKDQMESVITELHRQNLFHIEDFVEQERDEFKGFKIGMPLQSAGETSKELLKLRAVTNAFTIRPDDLEAGSRIRTQQLKERIEQELPAIENEVESLINRRSRIETHQKELDQRIEVLRPFIDVPIALEMFQGYRTMSVIAGYVDKKVSLDVPAEEYFAPSKTGNLLILVIPSEYRPDAERTLLDAQFQAIPIPNESGVARNLVDKYNEEIKGIGSELEEIKNSLEHLKREHAEFLVACDELLTIDIVMAEAPLRFATTDHAFIAEGWVPEENLDEIVKGITSASGGKAFITNLEIDTHHDVPPVEYNNVPYARPTEFLVDLYSRPKYTELDPTLFVSVVFPIFFGIILGDVGYGLMLLGAALLMRKLVKGDDALNLSKILGIASVSSIIFGLLFSEFLGFALPWPSVLPSRHLKIGTHTVGHGPAVGELMIMTLWIGIVYITVGRILGMINHARQDHGPHRTKAILANLGWIMVMWGIIFMLWSAFAMPLMPNLTGYPPVIMGLGIFGLVGAVMIIVGVIFIVRDSAIEVVELPTILSHVLSFARLAGVGLSSVAIAMVVNLIAIGMLIEPQLENFTLFSIIIIIVGIVVFLVGHIFNAVLGTIGGGLQSIRLQYVEFFTKFYKGGGKKYSPFGMKRKFMED